ncbi:MAG TPA: glycosyltransferase [Nitrosopumilaceae archaeon]|nr:glycosyltransferase [Nitrosopumilaceae archaeon]
MSDTVIVRSNLIIYDPRVGKIARSLKKRYPVTVLGWNREGISAELIKSYAIPLKLFNLKAPAGKPSLVAYLPLFWIWIFFKLVIYRPQVVYACDFDTIFPCYLYKIILRKKLVFDIIDRYAMTHIPQKFTILYMLVNLFEEIFGTKADMFVTVSEKLLSTFKRKSKQCAIIMNCSEYRPKNEIKSRDNILTLVYTGAVAKMRGLERIAEAIKGLDGVEFVVAGKVLDQDLLEQILRLSNIKYKGLFQQAESIDLEASCDVMICLYDLRIPNFNFALPVKTFEAMMLGLPVITNVGFELIDEVDCGIKVEYDDLNQIKSAIVRLRDDQELRRRLGTNGRKAFEQKYNWDNSEQELYKMYDKLLR